MLSFTANQAKTRFGELMNKAQHEAVTITKNGRTAFVCLPAEDYEAFEQFKLESLRAKLAQAIAQAESGQLHDGEAVFEELMKDL